MKVRDRQKELTSLIKEKTDLDKALKEMEEDDKRIKLFKEWDETRVSWLDEMYDFTARFPDIKETTVLQFRAEPLAVQKAAKVKNVARITLKIQTADGKHVDDLQAAMHQDKRYHNVKKEIKGGAGALGFGRFAQTYEIRTDIEKRPPGEYVRKLTVPVPPKPGRGRDSGDDYGMAGGFGGADQ
jgi:hypothetical protein